MIRLFSAALVALALWASYSAVPAWASGDRDGNGRQSAQDVRDPDQSGVFKCTVYCRVPDRSGKIRSWSVSASRNQPLQALSDLTAGCLLFQHNSITFAPPALAESPVSLMPNAFVPVTIMEACHAN